IKKQAPQTPANKTNESVEVSIPVVAGEIIGYTSGGFPGRAFDFFMLNKAKLHPSLNQVRWVTDHSLYKTCPYDYFVPELKDQYYNLLAKEQGVRSCGPRVKEVPNAIAGYWFQGKATESNGPRFAIYGTNHFVEWTLVKSSETPIPYRTREAGFVLPEKVTEGNTACYNDPDRNVYVYVKMLPEDKLALVGGTGACPSSFPSQYEMWVR
ncbi:MAG: hypothetical protein AAB670_01985, partial [Patescibacteria group bacterium]